MLPTQPAALALLSTLHTDAGPQVRLRAPQHTLRYSRGQSLVEGARCEGERETQQESGQRDPCKANEIKQHRGVQGHEIGRRQGEAEADLSFRLHKFYHKSSEMS